VSLNKAVSERIKARRAQLGYLRGGVAELSGLAYARYCSIERGETQITVDDLFKIAKALCVTPTELMTGDV
jgi:transcriptional regulator with XRE-family HTH domain